MMNFKQIYQKHWWETDAWHFCEHKTWALVWHLAIQSNFSNFQYFQFFLQFQCCLPSVEHRLWMIKAHCYIQRLIGELKKYYHCTMHLLVLLSIFSIGYRHSVIQYVKFWSHQQLYYINMNINCITMLLSRFNVNL